jgi:hypothetical protein
VKDRCGLVVAPVVQGSGRATLSLPNVEVEGVNLPGLDCWLRKAPDGGFRVSAESVPASQ